MSPFLADLLSFSRAFLTKLIAYMTGGAFMAGVWIYSSLLQKGDAPRNVLLAGLVAFFFCSTFLSWREERLEVRRVQALLNVKGKRRRIQDALVPFLNSGKELLLAIETGKPLPVGFHVKAEAWRKQTYDFLKERLGLLAAESFNVNVTIKTALGIELPGLDVMQAQKETAARFDALWKIANDLE